MAGLRVFMSSMIVAVSSVSAGVSAPQAEAAADMTPPILLTPPVADFVVGSQLRRGWQFEDDTAWSGLGEITYDIGIRVRWGAYDAESGICGYDVFLDTVYSEPILLVEGTLATEYVGVDDDYDDQFGGGSGETEGYIVAAHDCAGNTTSRVIRTRPAVIQEDSWDFFYNWDGPTYTGTWGRSFCECWSMGAVARTTQFFATASIANTADVRRFGLVMEKAPNRGKLAVVVNNRLRAIVDTGTHGPRLHRVVVWSGLLQPNDVLTIVNLATPGRPRIDLDAILVQTH